jgi:ElaB/YqjD/DUF883 family membrane-anchored ribosome-binding protein
MNSYETPGALRHDVNALADDAKALLAATSNIADQKVAEARGRLEAALAAGKEAYGRVQERALAGARAADKCVREHPYQSIAAAFGVGALVGYLFSRR